jgi:hypothetical protein
VRIASAGLQRHSQSCWRAVRTRESGEWYEPSMTGQRMTWGWQRQGARAYGPAWHQPTTRWGEKKHTHTHTHNTHTHTSRAS